MSHPAIDVHGLTKIYGSKRSAVSALDELSFTVAQSEIFGLIGADGAGKTTALGILSGILPHTSGEVRVLGRPPHECRDQLGYVTRPFSLYQDLTVLQNLQYVGGLKGVPREDFDRRCRHYLELFEMASFEHRLAGRLSGGMKQKLALCCALIANPRLLLLDEPTTGIDPVTRRDVWEALTTLAGEGMTIIVTSPSFDDAERCHRIAFMEQGSILRTGRPDRIRAEQGLARFVVRCPDLARAEAVLSRVRDEDERIADVQRFGDRLDVIVPDPGAAGAVIRGAFSASGLEAPAISQSSLTLENAFVATLHGMRGRESVPVFPGRARHTPASRRATEIAIGASRLGRRFGSFQAVRDFQIDVRYGEVYGLIGANGAGKTTAVKMLCGLLQPSTGEVTLFDGRGDLRSAAVRSQIGYMSQAFTLYDDLSIGENLALYASLYGLPDHLRRQREAWVLQMSGLAGKQDLRTGLLSGGWKQRVAFGAAVMHEPRVLFLDEPTAGVDPLARRVMWRIIAELADRGAAVLVVTHHPEEAEQCNRLGFMMGGEILAQGSPTALKASMPGTLIEIETPSAPAALRALRTHRSVRRVSQFGRRLQVLAGSAGDIPDLRRALEQRDIPVGDASVAECGLEDVFISLIERGRTRESPGVR